MGASSLGGDARELITLGKPITALIAALLAASIAATALIAAATASAGSPAPRGSAGTPAPRSDGNGDKLFDDLEARLAGKADASLEDVIVVLRAPASPDRVSALGRNAGGEVDVSRRFTIVPAFAARASKRAVQALARNPLVEHIESDATVRAQNDSARDSFGVTTAQADDADLDGDGDGNPSVYSAADMVAAVIDTGIDPGHQDLDENKVIAFRDFVNGLSSPYDDEGHGTHVSGTIAGDGDARPDHLRRGVAPAAALVGVKVLDSAGNGTLSGLVSGIQWAVDNRTTYGIEVLNLSLEAPGCSDGTSADSLAVNAAASAGLVPAVAAGNEGPGTCTIGSPGAATGALTVGAMADMGENGFHQAYFSNRGKTADGRIKPNISAPGVEILSAQAGTATGYVASSGTSMATPFVSGVALLMLDANPTLTQQQVKNAITGTAIDWARGADNKTVGSTGADIDYGFGRLDAYAALVSAGAPINSPPAGPDHLLREGTLAGAGSQANFPINVRDTRFPIAATLIIPSLSAGSARSPDFDLYLLDPAGNQVAASEFITRQEDIGFNPTRVGTYTVRVRSYAGSGGFFVDVSAGLRPPFEVPTDASPLTVSLVPAFRQTISDTQCVATGRATGVHGAPLAFSSCGPPAYVPGTAGRLGLQAQASATLTAVPGNPVTVADEGDVAIAVSATDVQAAAGGDYDPGPSTDVTLVARTRISDTLNGGALEDPATVSDLELPTPVACVATAGPQGSTCSASTSADAVTPGQIREGRSMAIQAFRVRLNDSGANGVRGDGDDRVFGQQGIYIP